MRDYLIYEHPLNERIRTFLRLEHLFGKLAYFLPQEEVWATRAVVEALLDILNVTARADIKTEILKEIDRHTAVLTRLAHQRGVDTERLQELLSRMEQIGNQVYQLNGQLGQALRENDFLKISFSAAAFRAAPVASTSLNYTTGWTAPCVTCRTDPELARRIATGAGGCRTAAVPRPG